MNSSRLSTVVLPILTLFAFIAASSLLRPVIWPDETRYLRPMSGGPIAPPCRTSGTACGQPGTANGHCAFWRTG